MAQPFDPDESYLDEVVAYLLAAAGFIFQLQAAHACACCMCMCMCTDFVFQLQAAYVIHSVMHE